MVEGGGLALVDRATGAPYGGVLTGAGLDSFPSCVRAAVIYENNLQIMLLEGGLHDLGDEFFNVLLFIKKWDDYGYIHEICAQSA